MSKSNKAQNIKNTNNAEQTVEVLYQKMGDRWFAFSLIDDEVFVGSLTEEEVMEKKSEARNRNSKAYKIAGNS